MANKFREEDHPRDDDGKFTKKGAGESSNPKDLQKDVPDLGAQGNITESSDARKLQEELPKGRTKQIEPFQTKEELLNFMQEDANISLEEAEKTYNAIYGYSCKEYMTIISGQREDLVDDIEFYIEKAPKHIGKVYRGMRFSEEGIEEFVANHSEGDIVKEDRFTSWSDNYEISESYANAGLAPVRVIIECDSKNGVGIKHISKRHYESEVLYSHKTKWLVKKIKKDEKTEKKTGQKYTFYHIKYEEV